MLYRNKKNGKLYSVIGQAINCTNAQDGQRMVIYELPGCDFTFVRCLYEFQEKFEEVK